MRRSVGGRGYGLDLRERIVAAVEAGHSMKAVTRLYGIHITTVESYLDSLPDQARTLMDDVRSLARSTAPEARSMSGW